MSGRRAEPFGGSHAGPSWSRLALVVVAAGAALALTSCNDPPYNQSPPVITGTAQVGATLSASTGTWSNSPTSFSYQWRRCDAQGESCQDIAGATTSTYEPVPADEGGTARVRVTARNAYGSGTATSAPTSTIAPPAGGSCPPL